MLQNLQVLRAVAALLVVIHHFLLANSESGVGGIATYRPFVALGACGVDLFFCISGFVMLGSVARASSFSPREFTLGRIVRIFPAYLIATSVFITLVAANHIQRSGLHATIAEPLFSASYILSSYLLVPAINPESYILQPFLAQGWTLSYEMYFYILLTIAAVLSNAKALNTALLSSCCLIIGPLVAQGTDGVAGRFLANPIMLEFVLGMLAYIVVAKLKAYGVQSVILGASMLAVTAVIEVSNRTLLWGIPCALILYEFVCLEGKFAPPRLLKLIGDASYSLYLTHGALTYVYGGLLKRGWFHTSLLQNVAVIFGTIIAVIVGMIFYRFVEKPMLNTLSRKLRSPRPVASTPEIL